jgi:hypothetical protein
VKKVKIKGHLQSGDSKHSHQLQHKVHPWDASVAVMLWATQFSRLNQNLIWCLPWLIVWRFLKHLPIIHVSFNLKERKKDKFMMNDKTPMNNEFDENQVTLLW